MTQNNEEMMVVVEEEVCEFCNKKESEVENLFWGGACNVCNECSEVEEDDNAELKAYKKQKRRDELDLIHEALEDAGTEYWGEECCGCECLLADKYFTDENEFDEHPDKEAGYDEDGAWWCPECKV